MYLILSSDARFMRRGGPQAAAPTTYCNPINPLWKIHLHLNSGQLRAVTGFGRATHYLSSSTQLDSQDMIFSHLLDTRHFVSYVDGKDVEVYDPNIEHNLAVLALSTND